MLAYSYITTKNGPYDERDSNSRVRLVTSFAMRKTKLHMADHKPTPTLAGSVQEANVHLADKKPHALETASVSCFRGGQKFFSS